MCLIIAKPKGLPMPGRKAMKRWFYKYPDGFGLAFQDKGQVRVLKGAMDIHKMFKVVDIMKGYLRQDDKTVEDVDVVIQFRYAITGSPCPEFCHPFPIAKEREALDSLNVLADKALAHNGTIWEYNQTGYTASWEDVNDAQEFIRDYLVDMGDSIWNVGVQALIEQHTYSKFAILSRKGIAYIGKFIESGGYWYSNDGYLKAKPQPIAKQTTALQVSSHKKAWEDGWTGVLCDFCSQEHVLSYQVPDDESCVCWDCFISLVGRFPTMDERAV